VLAVGDAEFQKKAIGKMQDVSRGEGRTVLFVSHNMAAVRRLCSRAVLLENGETRLIGDVDSVINRYLADHVSQSYFEGIDGDEEIMFLSNASVYSTSANGAFYNDEAIVVDFTITLKKKVGSFVCGFNVFSYYQYPLARADYNDRNHLMTLAPGTYHFIYEIPPYTLAIGEYSILFDVAERNVKRYTTDSSRLSFSVQQKAGNGFGNVFSERIPQKSSIFCEDWLKDYHQI
jgi:lipopolysaccharide transport system ATP-binding protein